MDRWKLLLKILSFRSKMTLDSMKYEDLSDDFRKNPERNYGEFQRRLWPYVYVAAGDYSIRHPATVAKDNLVKKVFVTFTGQFGMDSPMVLRRFARHIRKILDAHAFEVIAHTYYQQILLYYLPDDEQRQFLDTMAQEGLAGSTKESITVIVARRLNCSPEVVKRVVSAANASMQRVQEKEFNEKELMDISEGYLPQ